MTRPDLQDAFDHHLWANRVVLDVCAQLTPEQLASQVPGTYGSILDTMRHIVGADDWYLYVLTGGTRELIDEESMSLDDLRPVMDEHVTAWAALLAERRDPEEVVIAHRKDGSEGHAPLGIRLAQVVHHGTDHRSQICTGLTGLGIEPPDIDVWAFGEQQGRVFDSPGSQGG
jgi:uncharacterized damage-inducible protein DinB